MQLVRFAARHMYSKMAAPLHFRNKKDVLDNKCTEIISCIELLIDDIFMKIIQSFEFN